MKNQKITYQNLPIVKWFFVFAALFSFGGYSQYTPPKTKEVATELLLVTEERTDKVFHFKRALERKKINGYSFYSNASLLLISNLHSEFTPICLKNFNTTISLLSKRKTILIHLPKFPKEDSFLV